MGMSAREATTRGNRDAAEIIAVTTPLLPRDLSAMFVSISKIQLPRPGGSRTHCRCP